LFSIFQLLTAVLQVFESTRFFFNRAWTIGNAEYKPTPLANPRLERKPKKPKREKKNKNGAKTEKLTLGNPLPVQSFLRRRSPHSVVKFQFY
jgi:hypothetical protein